MIIGLTGMYCAGKNHIAGLLEQRGLPVLDVDKLGHTVIEIEKQTILSHFGNDILKSDYTIDRKRLGEKVFGKPAELKALEAIVHPAVNRETTAWIAKQNGSCVINAALLHRSSAFSCLDALIIVEASFLTRFFRARKRDRLSWREISKRLLSQKKFISQYFTRKADIYRVENPGLFRFGFLSLRRRAEKKLEARINEILSSLRLGV